MGDLQAWLQTNRVASRRYNVKCFDCGRTLCVARVPAYDRTHNRVDFEWGRIRPDVNGDPRSVSSRPKVKWKNLADGTAAVRCPCGMGAILSPADVQALARRAIADAAEDIILGAH